MTCEQCGVAFVEPPALGRPRTICSDECRKARAREASKRSQATRPKQQFKHNAVCADCGKPCQRSRAKVGWEPPAESRCMPCSRRKLRKYTDADRTCGCGSSKEPTSQICRACLREAQRVHRIANPPRTTLQKGYDKTHRRLRAAWMTIIELAGADCSRCGELILPDDLWHLDHTEDRSGYLGPAHSRCNLAAGGKKRAQAILKIVESAR